MYRTLGVHLISSLILILFSIYLMGCPGSTGRMALRQSDAQIKNEEYDGGFQADPSSDSGINGTDSASPSPDASAKFNSDTAQRYDAQSPSDGNGLDPKLKRDWIEATKQGACYIQQTVCKKHPEYAKPQKFVDELGKEKGSDKYPEYCRQRAVDISVWCENHTDNSFPVTKTTYEVGGQIIASKEFRAGNACVIAFPDNAVCPYAKDIEYAYGYGVAAFWDIWAFTHGGEADKNWDDCMKAGKYWYAFCMLGADADFKYKFYVIAQFYQTMKFTGKEWNSSNPEP